ncbi:MAG: TolC family protein [Bacteroidota bacterium]
MRFRFFPSALAVCLLAPAVTAQDLPPEVRDGVTLREAITLAIDASTEVARAELAEQSGAIAERGARAERLPSLNFSAQPSQSYGLSFDQTTGELTSQRTENFQTGLNANITLYDGGRVSATARNARLNRAASEASAERTRQTVAADVADRFLQLLLDRQLVEIQTEQLAAAEAQLDRAQRLVELGARPESDLPAQRATVAERAAALAEATAAVARDQVRLLDRLALPPFANVEFVGPTLDELAATGLLDAFDSDLEAAVESALASRMDLRSQELFVQAAEASEDLAASVSRPNLTAFGGVGTGYSSLQSRLTNPDAQPVLLPVETASGETILVDGAPFFLPDGPDFEFERTPFFTQLADNRSGNIGLSLTVPIFDRFAARRQREEARAQTEDRRIELQAIRQAVAAEVALAAVEIAGAEARLGAAEARVEAAQAAVEAEEARYALGATTPYDLADARSRLAEALAARAQSAFTLVFRRALLRLATGEDLSDLL